MYEAEYQRLRVQALKSASLDSKYQSRGFETVTLEASSSSLSLFLKFLPQFPIF